MHVDHHASSGMHGIVVHEFGPSVSDQLGLSELDITAPSCSLVVQFECPHKEADVMLWCCVDAVLGLNVQQALLFPIRLLLV